MGIRRYKPTTAGRRGASVSDFAELTPGAKPERTLLVPKRKTGGRNNQGRITARHRGGGHKQQYRLIDFRRNKDGVPAKVHSIQYDPNRSARIALLHYVDGEKRYIVAPDGLQVGAELMSGPDAPPAVGNCLPLKNIPLGTAIHCVELQPGRGGVLCRSAGVAATLAARDANWAQITLPSGEIRRVPATCRATIGTTGNADHMNIVLGQGRAQALDGTSAARARHGDESDRPSARRRRRPHQGRSASGQSDRQAGQGRSTRKPAKAFELGDRAATPVAAVWSTQDLG